MNISYGAQFNLAAARVDATGYLNHAENNAFMKGLVAQAAARPSTGIIPSNNDAPSPQNIKG